MVVQVGGLPLSGCIAIAWSPTGAIMQTIEKPDKEKGNAHKNLKVSLVSYVVEYYGKAQDICTRSTRNRGSV